MPSSQSFARLHGRLSTSLTILSRLSASAVMLSPGGSHLRYVLYCLLEVYRTPADKCERSPAPTSPTWASPFSLPSVFLPSPVSVHLPIVMQPMTAHLSLVSVALRPLESTTAPIHSSIYTVSLQIVHPRRASSGSSVLSPTRIEKLCAQQPHPKPQSPLLDIATNRDNIMDNTRNHVHDVKSLADTMVNSLNVCIQ
jgi:hypothetical protein